MNQELIKFDPTVEELNKIVEITKNINVSDLKDKKQLEIVKENRIALGKARINIAKAGKALRESAVKFQKDVIAKEKELIGIIEPEEDRLQLIEDKAKELAIREERLEKLPLRKERIEKLEIIDYVLKTDEELLLLDAVEFEAYFNSLVAYKNEYTARKIEQERLATEERTRKEREAENKKMLEEQEIKMKKIQEENEKIRLEQQKREAELLARENKIKEEKERIEREKQIKEAEEKAKKETEERLKNEAIEKEKRAIAEKKAEEERKAKEEEELKKKKRYIEFLKVNGYTKENANNFKIERKENGYALYKLIGELKDNE